MMPRAADERQEIIARSRSVHCFLTKAFTRLIFQSSASSLGAELDN